MGGASTACTLASSSSERLVWDPRAGPGRSNNFGVRMAGAKNRRKRKPLMARYFTSCGEGAAGERGPPNPLPSWENWDSKDKGSVYREKGTWLRRPSWSAKEAFLLGSVSPPGKRSNNTNFAPSDLAKHPQSLLVPSTAKGTAL